MALNWGIAGAGKISNDFVGALKSLPKTDHKVVAIAARSQNSADKFAAQHNIAKSYEGYINLAKDKEVQAIYIGVLNPQHYEVTKLMLENNKHVLCEKPFTMNERQTRDLYKIAEKRKLFLMEAIWSRCFPAYKEMERAIESGEIGEVLYASVTFGFPLQNIERLHLKEMGGGAILDLGIYILQLQQLVYRGLKPIKVVANGHLNKEGTDDVVSAIITYEGGKTAVVTASSLCQLPNTAEVVGSKGQITLPFFWCPDSLTINGNTKKFPLPASKEKYNFHNSVGLSYEADEVRKCIASGKVESPQLPWNESIQLAGLMDELRKQLGVVFPDDE